MEQLKSLPKKYIIVIIVVILGVILLALFAFAPGRQFNSAKPTPTPVPDQEQPQMLLEFSPNSIAASRGATFTSSIVLDTYGVSAAGVTITVTYKPNQVQNVKLIPFKDPSSALSYALNYNPQVLKTDEAQGIISENFLIPNSLPQQKGQGIIAKVTGKLAPNTQGTTIKISVGSQAFSRDLPRVALGKVNLEITAK